MWARLAGNAQSRSWICRELSPALGAPVPAGTRPEAGKASRRTWGAGSEAEGSAGEAFPG